MSEMTIQDAMHGHVEKIVLVLRDGLPLSTTVNVACCLSVGITAYQSNLAGHHLIDAAGLKSLASSHVPIVALKGNDEVFERLIKTIKDSNEGLISVFPAYARDMHNPEQYWQRHQSESHQGEQLLGIALIGAKKWLNKLTGNLPLLR